MASELPKTIIRHVMHPNLVVWNEKVIPSRIPLFNATDDQAHEVHGQSESHVTNDGGDPTIDLSSLFGDDCG